VALRRERQAHRVRLWLLAGGRSSSGAHLRLRLGKGPDEIESLGTEKNYPGTRGRLLQSSVASAFSTHLLTENLIVKCSSSPQSS
jgi:hypothetical protein